METPFEPSRINQWLRDIATTADDEPDCDALAAVIDQIAEAGARGEDLHAVLPGIALHLGHCPDCREWYDTLVLIAKQLDEHPALGGAS